MRTCYIFVFFIAVSLFIIGVYAESAQDWVKKGEDLRKQGDYSGAIDSFDKAIKFDPKNVWAWYWKAETIRDQKNIEEANSIIDTAIVVCDTEMSDLNDSVIYLWNYKLAAYFGSKKFQEGIKFIDQLITKHPNMADGYKILLLNFKSQMFIDMNQYEEAIAILDEVIQTYPKDSSSSWEIKGDALKGLERYDDSEEAYNRAIEIQDQYYQSHPATTKREEDDRQYRKETYQKAVDEVIQLSNSNKNTNTNTNNNIYNSGSPNNQNQAYNPNNDQITDNTGETNENPQVTSGAESEDYCCVEYLKMCNGDHDEKKYYAKGCTTADINKCARAHGMLPP